mmetsp:Transcript_6845/g.26429  ORF Transcript_6845/g.26429 Transcript_6845/m.26429 type:complete len:240 (-) Transcript_6845:4721-5440(-)|eukprot:scaffold1435_cov267-Pinguiococcus_pyrenoidosus.AAC.19
MQAVEGKYAGLDFLQHVAPADSGASAIQGSNRVDLVLHKGTPLHRFRSPLRTDGCNFNPTRLLFGDERRIPFPLSIPLLADEVVIDHANEGAHGEEAPEKHEDNEERGDARVPVRVSDGLLIDAAGVGRRVQDVRPALRCAHLKQAQETDADVVEDLGDHLVPLRSVAVTHFTSGGAKRVQSALTVVAGVVEEVRVDESTLLLRSELRERPRVLQNVLEDRSGDESVERRSHACSQFAF